MRRRLLGSVKGLFIPNHQIWYTTTNGEIAEINDFSGYGANIISNTYSNGRGIIQFDGDVTKTSVEMFKNCLTLESVSLPNKIAYIGTAAFQNCTALKTVKLPKNLTEINSGAFYGCSNMESLELPKSVTKIYSSAFSGCTGEVTLYCNLPSVEDTTNSVFYDSNISKIIFGSGVTSIGDYALSGLNVQEVEFPDTLQSLGEYTLSECRSLRAITVKAIDAPVVADTTFRYVGENGTLIYPTGSDYSTWLNQLLAYGWTYLS